MPTQGRSNWEHSSAYFTRANLLPKRKYAGKNQQRVPDGVKSCAGSWRTGVFTFGIRNSILSLHTHVWRLSRRTIPGRGGYIFIGRSLQNKSPTKDTVLNHQNVISIPVETNERAFNSNTKELVERSSKELV